MADSRQTVAPGGHYSGSNPIPTVKEIMEKLDIGKKDRDKEIDEKAKQKVQKHQKSAAINAGHMTGEQATSVSELKAGKKQKLVTDPVTGKEVVIENAKKDMIDQVQNPKLTVPNANLGKDAAVKTDASQSGEEYRYNQDVTAPPAPVAPNSTTDVPIAGEKTNILFHPTPSVSFEPMFASLEKQATGLCAGVFFGIIIVGRIFHAKYMGLIPLAVVVSSGIWLWMKEVVRSGREMEWRSEQKRGETATANLLPESVEWINTMLQVGWGMINPEMFIAVADTLEDVMQASLPGIIENVRVSEISQGSNPIRILSMRSLPDSHVQDMKDYIHEENKKSKDPQEAAADEEGGDYYNLEVALAYHALPSGDRVASKARNMHMGLVFYFGIKGLFGVPFPIFVELQSLVVTARIRLHLTREPPFLKTLTMTLMGVPHVQAGCIPMLQKGVNILNLPLISNFVNYAIAAASSMYIAPKSLMLDMRAMLQGDDIQKDVRALGILWIRIHRAKELSKQDRSGSPWGGSDPYITLAFSKYGKPMFCTRVITDDVQPIFEESCALLVTPELIQAQENLSVELWDSDRHTADDICGKIELSLQKMIQHPGKMFSQASKLTGMDADSEMPGELVWEVGYYEKTKFREVLRSDGKNTALPKELRDDPKFQDEKGIANNEVEESAQNTPPDPLWPTGIASIVVHQIVNLELENIKGTSGSRNGKEFEPAKPYGEIKEESGGHLPTSYCTIHLNDELVYRTRAKAVSSQPIFNAGTEKFIRDWRSAIFTVTVRDSRNREHDPILGVVPLKLSDILETSSQVTRWFPLDGGIGFGRMRISLLFRSVETRLPPQMIGFDVGTFESDSTLTATGYSHAAKLKLRTGGSTGAVSRSLCKTEGDGLLWELGDSPIRLPIRYRYRSPVVFEFHVAGKRKADAYSTLWLQNLVDNDITDIDIPIWQTKNPARLIQNYITEKNYQGEPGLEDLKIVGRLKFRGRFKAGLDETHKSFISNSDARETYEAWEACLAEGVRTRIVEKEVPAKTQELHEKSLAEGRDIVKSELMKKGKLDDKEGANWGEVFEQDPVAFAQKREDALKKEKAQQRAADAEEDETYHSNDDESESGESSTGSISGLLETPNMKHHSNPANHPEHTSKDRSSDVNNLEDTPTGLSDRTQSMATFNSTTSSGSGFGGKVNRVNTNSENRKHRGMMQWKPVRNAVFAKDQSKIGLKKLAKKVTGSLDGRQPGVESEISQQ